MNEFLSALGMLTLLAASLLILKCFGFKGAPVVAAIATVSLSGVLFGRLSDFLTFFDTLEALTEDRYISSAVRIIGAGYLGGVSADVCRELGEGGVAKCITTVTRLELIAVSLPYISELFGTVTDIMGAA